MSFFGSTQKQPKPKKKLAGFDSSLLPSNEAATVIPYWAGTCRLGVTWISQPFDAAVTESKNKKTAGGKKYSGSFLGLIGHGPGDRITHLVIDEEIVWEGSLSRGSTEVVHITVPSRGTFTIMWGTDTVGIDSRLATLATPRTGNPTEIHSAYRGYFCILADQVVWGDSRPTTPEVQVIAARFPTMPSWFTPPVMIGTGVNLPALVYELFTHPRMGIGCDASLIDQESFLRTGAILEHEGIGLSPLITERRSMRQLLVELCEHVGAYPVTRADGKLYLELVRDIPDPQWVPAFNEDDLVDPPDWSPGDPSQIADRVAVTFTDKDLDYQTNSVSAPSATGSDVLGYRKPLIFDRKYFTNSADGWWSAHALAAQYSTPWAKGTNRIRKSRTQGILPGSVFRLSWGHQGLSDALCRAESVSIPRTGQPMIEVAFREERGWLNRKFATAPTWTPPENVSQIAQPATHQRLWEIPLECLWNLGILVKKKVFVATLVARDNGLSAGFYAHILQPDSSYLEEPEIKKYCQHGTLVDALSVYASYDAGGDVIGLVLDVPDSVLDAPPGSSRDTKPLLAVIDDEVFVLYNQVLISSGRYTVQGTRAARGTFAASHTSGSDVWIFREQNLEPIPVEGSPLLATAKAQPLMVFSRADLAHCVPFSCPLHYLAFRPPAPTNLAAFTDILNPVYSTGQDIPLTWDLRVTSAIAFWLRWEGGVTSGLPEVSLDFLTTGGLVVATVDLGGGSIDYTWTNAALVIALSGETTFKVQVYSVVDSLRSIAFDEITVTKI